MPEETLALRMKAFGSRSTKRDVDRVSRGVLGLGASSTVAAGGTTALSAALTFLQARLLVTSGAVLVLIAVLGPPLLIAIGLLTAAVFALGAVFLGVFALGAGAMLLFKSQADEAGTAAAYLKNQLVGMKNTFAKAVTPGANAVLEGLARALAVLQPLVESMRPAFTTFGRAIGSALGIAAQALVDLGPEIRGLLTQAAPMVTKLAILFGPLLGAMIDIASYGMPVLSTLLDWLISFATWLRPALAGLNEFANSGQAAGIVGTTFAVIATAATWLWQLLSDLWTMFKQIWVDVQPLVVLLGTGLLVALYLIGKAVSWLADHFEAWKGILYALGIVAAIIFLPTIGWIALLVLAVLGLYKKWGWFHRAVNNTATFITGSLIPALKSIWTWIKTAFGDAVDFVKPKIEWLIDKLKWIVDKAKTVANVAGKVTPGGVMDTAADVAKSVIPGLATGGVVHRGGVAVVGERGPELVNLPTGSSVSPNGEGGDIVIHLSTQLDGREVAKNTHRQAIRRRSTR